MMSWPTNRTKKSKNKILNEKLKKMNLMGPHLIDNCNQDCNDNAAIKFTLNSCGNQRHKILISLDIKTTRDETIQGKN